MDGSVTRGIAGTLIERLAAAAGAIDLSVRDLAATPPALIDADWVDANFTDADQRTLAQRATLAESDVLVAELAAVDVLVIGVPIYNFGIPAALKAWVDMVARARLTFRYTEQGPEGLLRGKRAYLVVASGGTAAGSAVDFATGYLRHVLGFLGIDDVEIIGADRAQVRGPADTLNSALARIDALLPTGEAPLASAA
jgi:FMN-dependent NADH-azoreductase